MASLDVESSKPRESSSKTRTAPPEAGGRLAFHYVELRRVHPVSDRRLPRPLPGPEARGLGNQRESGINPNMEMRVRAGGFGRRPPCVVPEELESHASRQP